MHEDDPAAGPRGLTLGLLGGIMSWGLIAAIVYAVRRALT